MYGGKIHLYFQYTLVQFNVLFDHGCRLINHSSIGSTCDFGPVKSQRYVDHIRGAANIYNMTSVHHHFILLLDVLIKKPKENHFFTHKTSDTNT